MSAEHKVAVVTGGGSGIGRATATAFAKAGHHVVVADVDDAGGEETVASIGGGTFVHTDVAGEEDVLALFDEAARHGRVAVVHNNAGVTVRRKPIHELEADAWDRVLGVNLRGAWLVLRSALRAMRPDGGAIVNTVSVAGFAANPGGAAYCTSKAGLIMLTRVAALENGDQGIRVNAVAPGSIATPMAENFAPGSNAEGPPPTGRRGTAEEVAAAVVWLASDEASYVNGTVLTVDGGWTTSLPARAYASLEAGVAVPDSSRGPRGW